MFDRNDRFGRADDMNVKRRTAAGALLAVTLGTAAVSAFADSPTYVLGVPGAPTIYLSSDASDNPWLATNNAYAAMAVAATTGGVSRVERVGSPRMELVSAEAGFPLERAKPDYYLADAIEPPEGVDWPATHAAYLARPESERANFIFDDYARRVFAVKGGTVTFTWTLADGTSRPMTYTVSLSCAGRPRRIYWTDYPYNGPGVDLSGKFVKFFGSEELLAVRYGAETNIVGGVQQVVTNKVVSGLRIDQTTRLLYAHGQLQGQVVMAYYDTGLFERLLHVQVVEVCRPVVNRIAGEIGRALKPDGRGYDAVGLRAQPTHVEPSDNRGDWYYQHRGQYSYSPKHGNVYPLRPTKDCPWNIEVYWMETDEMEVDWPFELDHYACDWPSDATVFVRGDKDGDSGRSVYVPSDYSATLMSYQEPEGHARAVETDGTFRTLGEGWSLLKLTADDDIWFVPVHSIFRSNTDYFTLEPEEIRVGKELRLRGGSVAGLAPGFAPKCDSSSPGYIYRAGSDPVWNPDIYADPQPDNASTASATNAAEVASSSTDTNTYDSVIYAVSANNRAVSGAAQTPRIEVWWNTTINEEGMPKPLEIPTLPQVYSIRWPNPGETPQIVIASQLGSSSESIYSHNTGLYLAATNAAAGIPSRKYFDETDGGTLMFWAKAKSLDADGRAVLTLGNNNPVIETVEVGDGVVAIATPDDWADFATRVNSGEISLNARMVADVTLGSDAPRVGMTDETAYRGEFNGGGHVLTVDWTTDHAVDTAPVAPFPYVKGCTIHDLRVAGSLTGNHQEMGGLIGQIRSSGATISRCAVSAAISSTRDGDAHIGGFVGASCWESMSVRFYDCLFDGSLLGESTVHCAGFFGYNYADSNVAFYRCLFSPAAVTMSPEGAYTFIRAYSGGLKGSYNYYTTPFGRAQGTSAASMSAEDLVAALGESWTPAGGRPALAAIANAPYGGQTYLSVDLARSDGQSAISVACCGDAFSAPFPADGSWHHAAISLSPTNLLLYVDGEPSATLADVTGRSNLLETAVRGNLGLVTINRTEIPARSGTSVGEVLLWNKVLSGDEIRAEMHKVHTGSENHLTGCYTFVDGGDLAVTGTDTRTFTDKVLGTVCTARSCLCDENGPPARDTGVIDADADTTPTVYVQNDPAETGYNPNEEHAVVMPGSGGYVAWALRSDLNMASSSAPGVLIECVKGGRKAMAWFDVAVTNSVYPELAADCVAGKAFPGPHPIDLFDDPWCGEDSWDEPVETAPAFRDRKGQLWARAAGVATMRMYYRMQDGFAFPGIDRARWPAVGAAVPWLSLLGGSPDSTAVLSAQPYPWTWRVSWPEDVPEIEIGRTLTVAASGLPEVWNGKSVGVVWPGTDADRDATALLFDPTVAQTSGFTAYSTVAAAVTALGIKQGAGGNATLKKGRWMFDGLPPSISTRFYLDTTADVKSCLKLEGQMEDNSAGVSLLHVNVLNDEEREALRTLLDGVASTSAKTAWRTAIDALAKKAVRPSPHVVADNEDRVAYTPRDHYALFTMGATNYVTLIENDSTNALMNVAEGDPISMHVMKVVPKYYTGRVVTREDKYNLLSQQLAVIYAEAFAGEPEQYVFEWRKCRPRADGKVPDDFEGEYTLKFDPTAGLTRFTIGGQGDTLANMVNTYYAMRYRAASENSPAYATMGYNWSEWTDPPVLAEGWVQRVLNNVTPFAQRMRDFEENPAETPVSMVVQAGAPYEGDVALNQDNLTSVGLIQLYETILSKAESMSLAVEIDDADANKQLQLAVARLADLYNTLGDEAYTDALNPTIGFGGTFNTPDTTWLLGVDYGALSSSLFCFDNQVPTLLDEELALLRGRSGENAPSVRISPYYNRLPWNVTKSPVGGEVAYMVNYDITDTVGGDGGSGDGLIDAKDAAALFPQGHGDAYGHYLSALSGYYRLLRNPYFTWGAPAMGEMVVADAVANVDYYDEAQFAKAAYNVAKVAAETVDRTARKAYRDNGGATGAGYLDSDKTRNFGYGEWAARGGYGALCNWAVGNALLPAEPDPGRVWHYSFTNDEDDYIATELPESLPEALSADNAWTVELQVAPDETGVGGQPIVAHPGALVTLADESWGLAVVRDETSGMVSVVLDSMTPVTNTVYCSYWFYTNAVDSASEEDKDYDVLTWRDGDHEYACLFVGNGAIPADFPAGYDFGSFAWNPPEFPGWACFRDYIDEDDPENGAISALVEYDYEEVVYDSSDEPLLAVDVGEAPSGRNTLVAVRCGGGHSMSGGGNAEALLLDASGTLLASVEFSLPEGFRVDLSNSAHAMLGGGGGFRGEIGEVRVWAGVARSDNELRDKRECVSPFAEGLALYLRTFDDAPATAIADQCESTVSWVVSGGTWVSGRESGVNIAFEDEGLNRIDRSTVSELASLASLIPDIQKKVDRMDAGLNPLGLADGAMAFDLTPVNAGDGGKTHYEQIRERAGTALSNARRSLDKAQEYGSRLRLLAEASEGWENAAATAELETKNKLIEYFGYPYEGDIGPAGTYPQGYDGPDVYNYAWMNLEDYGINSVKDTVVVTRTTKTKPKLVNLFVPFWPTSSTEKTDTWTFEKSATGFIVKPKNITGRRRAQGKIQDAMAEFLVAYASLESKISTMENKLADYESAVLSACTFAVIVTDAKAAFTTGGAIMSYISAGKKAALKSTINALEFVKDEDEDLMTQIIGQTPSIVGAGMTVNTDPSALVAAAFGNANLSWALAIKGSITTAKNALAVLEAGQSWIQIAKGIFTALGDIANERMSKYSAVKSAWYDLRSANSDMLSAYRTLEAKQAAVETVIAEAERVIDERTLARQQAAGTLTKARYNEMFFRLARNNALSRYSAQFDLAQKYCYLAAQAYDYETGLLSSDPASGDAFLARIVGTRTLGEFDADGEPMAASDEAKGDGGLADILARMDENWLVLKPRLGINNPQPYATWFSLRHDLFRIHGGEDGDKAWKTELRKYVVDDLNSVAEFRHWCQPLAGSTATKEPALVIPFSSCILHGYNFFGEELAGGDSALDPTYYATHISSAGVHFEGYDDASLAKTPTAYLVPVGEDRMRAVGDPETVLSWKVVDQTIPAPYAIGSVQLDDPDWTPLYDGNTGGNDLGARIRKHPSFRAYYSGVGSAPSDGSLDCTRLVGRSAWNTKWLLIIPAGSLGASREDALSTFINGIDSNRDGRLDFKGVTDIKLGLKTYSTSGN